MVPVLLACACATLVAQQQFRARTDLVRLDVRVTDDHGPIRGLGEQDFVVSDNGKKVDVEVEELTDLPLDLVLVAVPLQSVDLVAADQTARVEAAIGSFLDQVEARDRLAVMLAGAPPRRLRGLEFGRPALTSEAFAAGAYAAPFDGIVAGLGEFDDADRRKALVLLTTGADFRSTVNLEAVAGMAAQAGPTFVAFGTLVPVDQSVGFRGLDPVTNMPLEAVEARVSGRVFPAQLQRLAKKSGGIAVNLSSAEPADLMAGMFVWLRTQYLVSYPVPDAPGRHEVSVKVKHRGARVVTRSAYVVN
ncbi:MAG: hypothetical protein R2752_05750 [Vicinamibacterales bacterium]